jgi:phenylpropionate dioxygenase-like ring-hydroxylating dioxygenase large terminal subunit
MAALALRERLRAVACEGGGAPMLPRECYTSTEFFEFEREAVFARSWVCVGRVEQIASPGDYLAPAVAGEPLLVARAQDGSIHAMSAVCRHRGEVLTCTPGNVPAFRCPLHFWSYDLSGRLIGAPRVAGAELAELRKTQRLPQVRHEIWHGFIFVNLDAHAAPLAPSLAKLEPCWENYPEAEMAAVPPVPMDQPMPWNWKVHLENFTDAYHPEFVHRGTHDFAPANHPDGGVEFTPMADADNAILRSVPLLKPDGGMMRDGWGEHAMFPPIESLSARQRSRLFFAMLPPSMTLVFAPGAIAYTLVSAGGAEATFAASDRQTGGGWLLPQSTLALPDFAERAATVREGASKIWAQDIPVNVGMQAGKRSRYTGDGIYAPLETTLRQFNAWLLGKYRAPLS